MPKKIFFNDNDLQLLRELSDDQLYILIDWLPSKTHDSKANLTVCMFSDSYTKQLLTLSETAAKEVSKRFGFCPATSYKTYTRDGLTYDTPEYRNWLLEHRPNHNISNDFLKQFSFYEIIAFGQ